MPAVKGAARHSFSGVWLGIFRRMRRRLSAASWRASNRRRKTQVGGELHEYVLGFCAGSQDAREYAELNLGRLIRTLEITPSLRTKLGYGEL